MHLERGSRLGPYEITDPLGAGGIRLAFVLGLLSAVTPGVVLAQHQLYWDALEVEARLDADGVLDVAERHTMVFTGDWNGGERVFNVRPRQRLDFQGMERIDTASGVVQPLQQVLVPDQVDEVVWENNRLRWRSRLPSDKPFADTRLVYVLRYKLSGVLQKDAEQYRIDHDFAFPDRAGPITRFSLKLALDPVWQPLSEVREHYTAGPLAPGQRFVLTVPLSYSGSGSPIAIDGDRPPEVVRAVAAILGVFVLVVIVFFVREFSLGRFAPLASTGIDSSWIESQIIAHPAEVVGAVWDGRIGAPEVVALIARMTAEGKLESQAAGKDSMTLRLMVDRETLEGHERALVNGLFFEGRIETSTAAVQEHYRGMGFDPAQVIAPYLESRIKALLRPGRSRGWPFLSIALTVAGAVLLAMAAYSKPNLLGGAIELAFAFICLGALSQIPGRMFRARMDWGPVAAALLMIPALVVSLGAAAFLWMIVGTGRLELPWTMIGAIAVWAICISHASINGLRSRQSRDAIAFRKRLATGRRFFATELAKPSPDLRDSWYPWLLSFGLGHQVDAWSTRSEGPSTRSSEWTRSTSAPSSKQSSSSSFSGSGWTGGGGRSGGAGASASWAAAAAGMAAGVAAPSSGSSGGGGSSSGGSSSGGSSGGGGGGGW